MLIFGRSLTHLLYICAVQGIMSRDEYVFDGTFCMSSDCFTNFWLAFCVEKLNIKFLFAPKS